MPGFIEPKRNLVFNEKTWRYVHVDQPVDIADDKLDDLLEQRSGYGPFTSRLASRAIDLIIDQAGVEGLALHYDFPREDVPEFVQTFATWLQDERGIAPTDEMRVAMYAHAANGGIKIDKTAQTGVRASTLAVRRQAACTAPTALVACQAPTASCSGASRAHRQPKQHRKSPRQPEGGYRPPPVRYSRNRCRTPDTQPKAHDEHLLHDQQDRNRPIRGTTRA